MKTRKDFPEGFVFGVATAAYQIEGSGFGGAGPSHWDTFAKGPGNVVRAEDGAVACDHYNRWSEDLDIMADLGVDAYRFSTSWARVMPDGRTVNPEGLDFYDRLVDGMLARDLAPYLTLYHWDLPAALSDLGGWTNPDIARWFGDYTDAVIARIGDRMAGVATLNEPWCVAYLSHYLGIHAPGLRDIRAAARAMHHVMKAHGVGMTRLRDHGMKNCGLVLNFEYANPADDSDAARQAAALNDAIYNRWFIQAATQGSYPERALEGFAPHMPDGWQDDMAEISQPMDFLGVNYYTRSNLAPAPDSPWPAIRPVEGPLEKTQMGWEVYPDGLRDTLLMLKDDYVGALPIYVTENGMAWADKVENGAVYDPQRMDYMARHLDAMREAIDGGVDLRGFFYWSLLDNYEWSFGFEKRFGLVHVDFDTQKRTPKASFHAYKAAIAG